MQYLSSNAPKDGTTIGLVHSSVPFAPLFDMAGANFDPRKFGWIGSLNSTNEICASWHSSGIRTWQDMLEKPFIVGGTGGGSQMETMPEAFNRIFGTKIKVISGYTSGNEVFLAMERGEVAGRCGVSYSAVMTTRPDWLPSGKVLAPVLIGSRRTKTFPDVPAVTEFAKDEATRQTLDVLLAYEYMDRPLLAPPGTPASRLAVLRKAFHDAMNDRAFLAEAERQNLELDEISGERIEKVLNDTFALPKERVEAAKAALSVGN
jgi:tripartite-type tricarboxylate transporter receptor subunit TctC